MTPGNWIQLANDHDLRQTITAIPQTGYQAVLSFAAREHPEDWDTAVALLHMVYAWMPTMLGPVAYHDDNQKQALLCILHRVRKGEDLCPDCLERVKRFANNSIVGASKLIHILNPTHYAIWDSRVARTFLWDGVTYGTYSTVDRYVEYLAAIREWSNRDDVQRECKALREQIETINGYGNLRVIELVLFARQP